MNENIFIELSVIPGNSFFAIKNKYTRAKKNTINFFEETTGQRIISFGIANDDRIIKLKLEQSEIYFTIRGKFTNVFYLDNNQRFHSFKSFDEEALKQIIKEFSDKVFVSGWNLIKPDVVIVGNYLDEIRRKFPVIGSEIIRETKSRSTNFSNEESVKLLSEVLEEIRNSKPCAFIDNNTDEVKLGFENFKSFPFTEKKLFDSVIEAQNYLLSKEHYLDAKKSRLKLIKNYLEREQNKVTSKIQNLQGVIERGSRETKYNKRGKLLLANINELKIGMKLVVVDDIFSSGEKVEIKLNPKLSPKKNIEYYFDKSKSERTAFAKTQELFKKTNKEFQFLKKTVDSLSNIQSIKELDELMKMLKIKPTHEKEAKEDLSSKFKHYLIDGKYNIYVGKDSKNNDLLTTKFAKQNDYWFHARSVSGSHVALRVENTKEVVPKNVLKRTASIAAFHSKAKTAGVVPVAYTLKKYVVKKKGDPVGTVHLLREDVLLVKPEIPGGCEFVVDE
ncbi:MAG: NFACT RNA binding domain-containing protein [Chlorobium sp.]|nr:NFACT RNA binding domain-containing protein [Chlorobium sp.]